MKPDDLEPLSDDLSSLLDAERPLDRVSTAQRARLLGRVTATMAVGVAGTAAGATATASTASAAGATAAKTAVGVGVSKVVIAAVAFSVGGGVGAGVHAVATAPQKKEVVLAAPPKPPVVELPVPPTPEPEVALVPDPVVAPPPPKPSPRVAAGDLDLERSLLDQARTALSRDDATAALAALRQHAAKFPKGQLTEERLALEVMAHARAGHTDEARAAADRFRKTFPDSLLLPAVDAALTQ